MRGPVERSLGDVILMSGHYREHPLPQGAFLREVPIAETEVYLLLDGLVQFEIDQQPVADAGPGAVFDPALRTSYSKEHAAIRAKTACQIATLSRAQLDSQALLGAAGEGASLLNAWRADHQPP
jgi:hypothetical protein